MKHIKKRPDEFKFKKYKPLRGQGMFEFARKSKQKSTHWRRPPMNWRRYKPLSGQLRLEIFADGDGP